MCDDQFVKDWRNCKRYENLSGDLHFILWSRDMKKREKGELCRFFWNLVFEAYIMHSIYHNT